MRVARVQTSRSDPRITSPNVRCSKQNEGELVSMTTELAGNGETSNDYLTHAWKLGVGGKEVSVAFLYVRVQDRAQGDTRTGCQQIDWKAEIMVINLKGNKATHPRAIRVDDVR
mmetsp:Transcript_8401/g.26145  ORF Transcript_8401/g.26145 Transcript_8401/m.26145 type:complete len:114 (+) Transcript_8401:259-600(+)